jgi:hypothetical protein
MTRTWRTKLGFPSAGELSKEYWASIWCVQTEFCYCPITCSPMVDDSDVGDHECLYHHVQHHYWELSVLIHSIWLGGPSRPSWSPAEFEIFLQWHHEIRDEHVHQQLWDDLVTHLWERGEETLHEFWSLQTFWTLIGFHWCMHYSIWHYSICYVWILTYALFHLHHVKEFYILHLGLTGEDCRMDEAPKRETVFTGKPIGRAEGRSPRAPSI